MDPSQARTIAHFLAANPRNNHNVAFIGRSDSQFAGNCKYFYLHMVQNEPEFRPCYVTLNRSVYRSLVERGLPAALFPEQDAITALARAGIVVVDDFHYRLNNIQPFTTGATIIQLWHGVGFKKIGFLEADSTMDMPREQRDYLRRMYSGYDAVISTSPFYTEHLFQTSFGAREIWETGYPRNDVLLRPIEKNDLLGSDVALYGKIRSLRKQHATCLYAPTFRDDRGDPFSHKALDLPSLNAFLREKRIMLFIKMHEFSVQYDLENMTNIHVMPNHLDVYPILPLFDCLVTDYSSIYMDYLLLNKPVIFFPYDRNDYGQRLRQFQFDYDAMTPGPKCLTQQEIQGELMDVILGKDQFKNERAKIKNLAFRLHDALSASRVMARLRTMVQESSGQDSI